MGAQTGSKIYSSILGAVLKLAGGMVLLALTLLAAFAQLLATVIFLSAHSPSAWMLAGGCLSGALFYSSLNTLSLASRFRKVAKLLEQQGGAVSLKELSRVTGRPEKQLCVDLQKMIHRQYFSLPVQLDLYREDLVAVSGIILPSETDALLRKEVERRPLTAFWAVLPVTVAGVAVLDFSSPLAIFVLAVSVLATLIGSYRLAAPIRRLVEVQELKPKQKKTPPSPEKTPVEEEQEKALREARNNLDEMRRLGRMIPQSEIDRSVRELSEITEGILAHLEKHPEKIRQVRQFLSYYLPTTVKLLHNYDEMYHQAVKGENIQRSLRKIEGMMGDIRTAFRRELDNLYLDRSIDISAEVDVMQGMLRQDGAGAQNLGSKEEKSAQ